MTVREIDKRRYRLPPANPTLHTELAWYATEDDTVLGVVILDLVDRDFSWVALIKGPRTLEEDFDYHAVDWAVSLATPTEAAQKLHTVMLRLSRTGRCAKCQCELVDAAGYGRVGDTKHLLDWGFQPDDLLCYWCHEAMCREWGERPPVEGRA